MNLSLGIEFSALNALELLSIGLVAEDGRECYVEIGSRASRDTICQDTVCHRTDPRHHGGTR